MVAIERPTIREESIQIPRPQSIRRQEIAPSFRDGKPTLGLSITSEPYRPEPEPQKNITSVPDVPQWMFGPAALPEPVRSQSITHPYGGVDAQGGVPQFGYRSPRREPQSMHRAYPTPGRK